MTLAELDMPTTAEVEKKVGEEFYRATQWQLIWWAFRRHVIARIGLNVLGLLYCLGIFCQFVSPYQPLDRFGGYLDAPPHHRIRFFHEGKFMRPYNLDVEPKLDMETFRTKDTLIKGVWECLARVSTSDHWGRRGQGQKPRA